MGAVIHLIRNESCVNNQLGAFGYNYFSTSRCKTKWWKSVCGENWHKCLHGVATVNRQNCICHSYTSKFIPWSTAISKIGQW